MFRLNLLGVHDLLHRFLIALRTVSGTICTDPRCVSWFGRVAEQSPSHSMPRRFVFQLFNPDIVVLSVSWCRTWSRQFVSFSNACFSDILPFSLAFLLMIIRTFSLNRLHRHFRFPFHPKNMRSIGVAAMVAWYGLWNTDVLNDRALLTFPNHFSTCAGGS